jgi:hypothetical protein
MAKVQNLRHKPLTAHIDDNQDITIMPGTDSLLQGAGGTGLLVGDNFKTYVPLNTTLPIIVNEHNVTFEGNVLPNLKHNSNKVTKCCVGGLLIVVIFAAVYFYNQGHNSKSKKNK